MNELCRLTRLTNNIRLPARHSTCSKESSKVTRLTNNIRLPARHSTCLGLAFSV